MKMLFKLLALVFAASLFLAGWVAWSFVHDVTSQRIGAFGVHRFALVVACVGIALLFIFVIFRFPFSRLALGGCALLGFAISLDSVLNYPAEAENLAYSMVFSPDMPELYFSIVVGIGLFLTALILPRR